MLQALIRLYFDILYMAVFHVFVRSVGCELSFVPDNSGYFSYSKTYLNTIDLGRDLTENLFKATHDRSVAYFMCAKYIENMSMCINFILHTQVFLVRLSQCIIISFYVLIF